MHAALQARYNTTELNARNMTGVITGTEPSSSVSWFELAVRGAWKCFLRGFTRHHEGLAALDISSFRF